MVGLVVPVVMLRVKFPSVPAKPTTPTHPVTKGQLAFVYRSPDASSVIVTVWPPLLRVSIGTAYAAVTAPKINRLHTTARDNAVLKGLCICSSQMSLCKLVRLPYTIQQTCQSRFSDHLSFISIQFSKKKTFPTSVIETDWRFSLLRNL